jgi:succinate dehydrogenase / fumarate reductase iron-sulfur subunit
MSAARPQPPAPPATCRLEVFRYRRGDGHGRFETFEVPISETTTLLDALLWIKHHLDPSLALRHSCLHASCGTCGMVANGREVLGCVTRLRDLGGQVRVEPLENLPVLTDLVVDMGEFFARLPADRPLVRASEFLPDAEPPADSDGYVRYEDCLECGLCLSACPVAATSTEYVGPAALVAAARMMDEPRGRDPAAVAAAVDGGEGAWRCHAAFECTSVCPAGIDPGAVIMHLRGDLLRGVARRSGP